MSVSTPNFLMTRPIWAPMVWLGLRVSKGFWNTIWSEPICCGERSRTGIFEISAPSWRMRPSVAVSSPMSTFAKVDFPQPDSPTMATVSPRRASKLSCSFAFTCMVPVPARMALIDRSWTS